MLESHLALLTEASSERPARIVALLDDLIIVSLRGKVAGRLTESEYRLLKQLIRGLKLSDAADWDGVSHETKRTPKAIPDMPAHFMASMLANGSVNVLGVGRNQDQTIEISHAGARFGMEVFIPW